MFASVFKITALHLCLLLPSMAALTDGLAAYYDFESDLSDKSGNNRTLAVASGTPAAAWNGGTVSGSNRSTLLVGKALNLIDSENDVLLAPLGSGASATSGGYHNLGSNFTISAWHYLAPVTGNSSERFFVFEGASNYDVSWGTTGATGTEDFYKAYNGQKDGPSAFVNRNEWHHVAHVFAASGSNIICTVYVDGASIGTVSAAAADMNFARLRLGDARSGQSRCWDGMLDEVAVWNRPLSAAEVTEVYQRGAQGIALTTVVSSTAQVSLSSANPMQGDVIGSGTYFVSGTARIAAQPAPGYLFVGWSGDFTGQPASFSHTVQHAVSAVANFLMDTADSDGDGLSNFEELAIYNTNPNLADTDGDGIDDKQEIERGLVPAFADTAFIHQTAAKFEAAQWGEVSADQLSLRIEPGTSKVLMQLGFTEASASSPWSPVPVLGGDTTVLQSGELDLKLNVSKSLNQIYGRKPLP